MLDIDFMKSMENKAVEQLKSEGHNVIEIVCDVSDDAQIEAMVNKTIETVPSDPLGLSRLGNLC